MNLSSIIRNATANTWTSRTATPLAFSGNNDIINHTPIFYCNNLYDAGDNRSKNPVDYVDLNVSGLSVRTSLPFPCRAFVFIITY